MRTAINRLRAEFSTQAWYISRVAPVPFIVTMVGLIVALYHGNTVWHGFAWTLAIWLLILVTTIRVRDKPGHTSFAALCFFCAGFWWFVPIAAAIPFLFATETEDFPGFGAAVFEAMSGYTSTGLSVVDDPSRIAPSLQIYRSLMQWVGGLGFVLFATRIIDWEESIEPMIRASPVEHYPYMKADETVRMYMRVYIILTSTGIMGLLLFGVPPWEAINHGLTIVSTGGFVITDNSLAHYSNSLLFFCGVLLFLAALPFPLLQLVLRRHWWRIVHSTQLRVYLLWATAAMIFVLLTMGIERNLLFNTLSALTTAGFHAGKAHDREPLLGTLVIALMLVGGCAASTAGGIKINRLAWLLKGLWVWHKPEQRVKFSFNSAHVETAIAHRLIRSAGIYLVCFIAMRFVATSILVVIEQDLTPERVAFDVSSAMTTTGLSSGFVGSDLHSFSFWMLSFLMWSGRLEYQSVLIFILFLLGRNVKRARKIPVEN